MGLPWPEARGWPPFAVFSDSTLREVARVRPTSLSALRGVYGIGDAKLQTFGDDLMAIVVPYCRDKGIAVDQGGGAPRPEPAKEPTANAEAYFPHFRRGASISEVITHSGRVSSTVVKYLCMFIESERPASIVAWVPADIHERVLAAAKANPSSFLRPIYDALGGQVSYDMIRIVLTHRDLGTTLAS